MVKLFVTVRQIDKCVITFTIIITIFYTLIIIVTIVVVEETPVVAIDRCSQHNKYVYNTVFASLLLLLLSSAKHTLFHTTREVVQM